MERQITDTREIALTADQLAGVKNYSDSKVVKTVAPEVEEVEMPAQNMFDNAAGLVAQAEQTPNQVAEPVAKVAPIVESAPVNMFDAPSAPVASTPAEPAPMVESPAIEQTSLTQDIQKNISNEDDSLILECRALGQDIINIYMRYEALVEQVNLRLTGKTLNNQNQTMQM